jgi:hypothetical protein
LSAAAPDYLADASKGSASTRDGVRSQQQVPEAFGQTGVRQFVGPMISWLCVIGMFCAGGMWYRSTFFADSFEWRGGREELQVASIAGRLKVSGATFADRKDNAGAGWMYRGRYFKIARDAWEPSAWKTIGIEVGFEPERQGPTGGFWLRAKWYFVAAAFAVYPALRLVLRLARKREEPA